MVVVGFFFFFFFFFACVCFVCLFVLKLGEKNFERVIRPEVTLCRSRDAKIQELSI